MIQRVYRAVYCGYFCRDVLLNNLILEEKNTGSLQSIWSVRCMIKGMLEIFFIL